MDTFQSVNKSFKMLGLKPPQLNQHHHFNAKNLTILFIFCITAIGTNMYLVYEATTFKEFTDSFYIACSAVLSVVYFTTIISRINLSYELFDRFRDHINKSIRNMFIDSKKKKKTKQPILMFRIYRGTESSIKSNLRENQPTSGKIM